MIAVRTFMRSSSAFKQWAKFVDAEEKVIFNFKYFIMLTGER